MSLHKLRIRRRCLNGFSGYMLYVQRGERLDASVGAASAPEAEAAKKLRPKGLCWVPCSRDFCSTQVGMSCGTSRERMPPGYRRGTE